MASRRRTSPKAEPLDLDHELDEMYSSSITRPNLGFLRVAASSATPLSMDAPSIDSGSFPTKSDDSVAMDSKSTDTTSQDAVSVDTASMDIRPPGKWKMHRCLTVQDGHSANEQLLYELLWRSAKEVNPDERNLAISREDMASQTRITVRNVKGVLDRLIEKLAVERMIEANSFARTPATYRIHSYRLILERRRKAGLEWVTRANGVKFIPSEVAKHFLSRPKFSETDPSQPKTAGSIDGVSNDMASVDIVSIDSISMDTRSSVPHDLGPGLRKINPVFDTAAVASLWRACRMLIPDCTVAEVLHFSRLKAAGIAADKSTRNPIALLLTTVSEFFTKNAIYQFREAQINVLRSTVVVSMDDR